MVITAGALAGISLGASALSGGLNFLGGSFSSSKQYKQQAQLMAKQAELTRYLNQNAYQDTMYSMRQAGLNPMLAFSNGINGLSAGGGSVGMQSPPNLDLSSAVDTYMTTKLNDSQIDLNKQSSSTAKEQAENLKAQTETNNALRPFQIEEIKNNIKNSNKIADAQVKNLADTGQASLISAGANQTNANTNRYIVDNDPKKIIVDAVRNSKAYKTSAKAFHFLDEALVTKPSQLKNVYRKYYK